MTPIGCLVLCRVVVELGRGLLHCVVGVAILVLCGQWWPPLDKGGHMSSVWVDRYVGGYYVVSALVMDKNRAGNPWGAPWLRSIRYEGYSRREAVAMFRDSLIRDGLRIVTEE